MGKSITNHSQQEFPDLLELLIEVFDNAQVAIVIADNDTVIRHVNPEFTRLLGYSREEALENKISDLIIPDKTIETALGIQTRVDSGERVEYETWRQTKDGNNSRTCQGISHINEK